jgi:hypothetical protein
LALRLFATMERRFGAEGVQNVLAAMVAGGVPMSQSKLFKTLKEKTGRDEKSAIQSYA